MKKLFVGSVMTVSLLFAGHTVADDRIDHFKGLPADTLDVAVANFSEYNKRLATVLAGEINTESMTTIHELTYTLENALAKIHAEVTTLVDTLEELHVASETYQPAVVKDRGAAYLSVATEIVR